jgi:hypothetical protein
MALPGAFHSLPSPRDSWPAASEMTRKKQLLLPFVSVIFASSSVAKVIFSSILLTFPFTDPFFFFSSQLVFSFELSLLLLKLLGLFLGILLCLC